MKKQNNISKKQLKDLLEICDAYEKGFDRAISNEAYDLNLSNPYPRYSGVWYAFEYGFYTSWNNMHDAE